MSPTLTTEYREPLPALIPTPADLAAFERREIDIRTDWSALPHDWHCPSCNRSKHGIVRWGRHAADSRRCNAHGSPGWKAVVTRHHCHGPEHGYPQRFETITICGDCNSVDARIKGQVPNLIPKWFSMTPAEIGACITSEPKPHHGFDRLDLAASFAVKAYSRYHVRNLSAFIEIAEKRRMEREAIEAAARDRCAARQEIAESLGYGSGRRMSFKQSSEVTRILNARKPQPVTEPPPPIRILDAAFLTGPLVMPRRAGFGRFRSA